ncbi:MAG: multidrug ABC transporter ATP-binding protein [Parcubacteria group bacterium 21-54-25]|nr:MAG: multidrug ABC transporter ATP-binding protein [Parcubacteria group bacterium 21-54-25]HQU08041.1 ATP-binding cassette domain-containing protein [Candidatus Paceibacterota bacterium]
MDAIITVEHLTKTFGEGPAAVQDISFTVARGSIVAFLGPNGAGKSTTIKMLTTLLRPTAGTIRIAGHDPATNPDAVRHAFGIVFQDPSLDEDLTAFENLEFHGVLYGVPKETRRARITELLALVELSDRKDDFVRNFSGGMKRRLEIARGLLHHPQILFLDEPTLGLDPQTRNHLWSYVEKLNREEGITVFFTTHYMEEADRVAQHIAIIDHGRIVAEGSGAALKKQTKSNSLEDAFLMLTGNEIRAEAGNSLDRMRNMRSMHRGARR